jgi:hypothetical protein
LITSLLRVEAVAVTHSQVQVEVVALEDLEVLLHKALLHRHTQLQLVQVGQVTIQV